MAKFVVYDENEEKVTPPTALRLRDNGDGTVELRDWTNGWGILGINVDGTITRYTDIAAGKGPWTVDADGRVIDTDCPPKKGGRK